jgi:hypothetical protein
MENDQNDLEKDEIVNPEQFQVGRAPHEEKEEQAEELGYTEQESQFADGQGTQLDEELGESNEEEADRELPDDLDGLSLENEDEEEDEQA